MAIEYRSVNADDVETQVKAGRAQEAEANAFAQEMEVLRLEAVASKVTKKEEKDALREMVKEAKATAKESRKKANRMNSDGVLDDGAVTSARANFLQNWITSLEQEHVAHSTIIAQREAALASTGVDAPNDADKKDMTARLEESKAALDVIESSWKVATAEYDSLVPDEE